MTIPPFFARSSAAVRCGEFGGTGAGVVGVALRHTKIVHLEDRKTPVRSLLKAESRK